MIAIKKIYFLACLAATNPKFGCKINITIKCNKTYKLEINFCLRFVNNCHIFMVNKRGMSMCL